MLNEKYLIKNSFTAKEAITRINEMGEINNVLFVVDEKMKLLGTLTDGDIRRGFLKELTISNPVESFMNPNYKFIESEEELQFKLHVFRKNKIRFVPVIEKDKTLLRILDIEEMKFFLPVDAMIMAGGRGERLRPLTDEMPKPMLKVGDKPILEHAIDRLAKFGVKKYYISLGYLGEKISAHFGKGQAKELHIQYVHEKEPLGTIGAAASVNDFSHDVILIMNSDLLTNIDYGEFYETFKNSLADMAVATVPYNVNVPYAVMDIGANNAVSGFKEKPVFTYYSNAGIYLIKKHLLKYIPANARFDATDLMDTIMKNGHKIVSFPILAYWLDIGRMEDYQKAQEDIKHLNL